MSSDNIVKLATKTYADKSGGGGMSDEVKDEIVALDSSTATVGDVVKAVKKTYVAEHTVSFGGKAPDQKVLDGDSATRPGDPAGYLETGSEWYGQWHDFSCWQLDGEEYDFSQPVAGDIALTAATTAYPCVIISGLNDLVSFQSAYKAAALAGTVPDGLVVRLEADIDMNGVSWESIGLYKGSANNPSYAFTGTFDGQGHRISNVTFADLSEGGTVGDVNNYRGFFGYVSKGTVRNLTVANAGFSKKTLGDEYGGAMVVGCQSWGSIENCVSEGSMNATHNAAGICARLELFGIVSKCTNKANLTGSYTKIGGIVSISQNDVGGEIRVPPYYVNNAYHDGCRILDCRNEGTITADGSAKAGRDGVGGIVGYADAYGWTTFSGNVNTGAIVKGANANDSGKYGQLIGFFNVTGSIGVNYCKTGSVAVGMVYGSSSSSSNSHLAFATVDGDTATTVVAGGMATTHTKDDLVLGGTYKVMASNATYTFKEAGRIVLDESLATVKVTSGVSGCSVQKVQVFGRPAEYSLVEGEATDLEITTGKVAQVVDNVDALVEKVDALTTKIDSANAELETIA